MKPLANYEQQVYAGLLGKVIGVYLGRPIENWTRAQIASRFGSIRRYVHQDCGVPLVVSDDDISGTVTFPRALEDSGRFGGVTALDFGHAWLNYAIEEKSIFWWAGAGTSTEHTAFLRLKQGIMPPDSGSIETNGRIVAEQIGAQIFIDALGLLCPDDPEKAADLARKQACVSHGGEAINAAVVVAAMVATAFSEKKIPVILDTAIRFIPADSVIARMHRQVREWCATDGNWITTAEKIEREYHPSKYTHLIVNHALMVMAWSYAPDDFWRAQEIINSAGWDTDCNAANVGSVMGLVCGLEGINRRYDFQTPFADRMVVPTAEGSRGITDVAREADWLASLGRKVMGWPELTTDRTWHNFHFPGSRHGWMPEDDSTQSRGAACTENPDGKGMRIHFHDLGPGLVARISTPVTPLVGGNAGPYAVVGTPLIYPGQKIILTARCTKLETRTPVTARLFLRTVASATPALEAQVIHGATATLSAGTALTLSLQVPALPLPAAELGIEISGDFQASGELVVERVARESGPDWSIPGQLPLNAKGEALGWLSSMRFVSHYNFLYDDKPITEFGRDFGFGVLVTGNREWKNYFFEASMVRHMSDRFGMIVRYQGLERFLALIQEGDSLRLVERYYGWRTLAEIAHKWPSDEIRNLRVMCRGKEITCSMDGKILFTAVDDKLGAGGAGILLEMGKGAFRSAKVGCV